MRPAFLEYEPESQVPIHQQRDEQVQMKAISFTYINTKAQLADALTKPVPTEAMRDFGARVGLTTYLPSGSVSDARSMTARQGLLMSET